MAYPNNTAANDNIEDKRFQTKYFRASRNSGGFVALPRSTVLDDNLEDDHIGFLMRVFSNAETWKIIPKYIAKQKNRGGINKVYHRINHLIKHGYAVRLKYREKLPNGRFSTTQYFGYHFFDVKATKEDIASAKKEFKKCFRNPSLREHGDHDHGFSDIDKQEEEINNKETTTPPIVDNSDNGSKEPTSSPPLKKEIKNIEMKPTQESLPLFHHNKKYLKGLSENEITQVQMFYEKNGKENAENPIAWITECVRGKWYKEEMLTDQDLQENFKFARRIEDNFVKLGKNNSYTYVTSSPTSMFFMKAGKEIPMPSYRMQASRFQDSVTNILINKHKYSNNVLN